MSEMNIANARLLLVEDNPRMLDMIKKFMYRYQYTNIVEARSANEASAMLDKDHFDVIIADMRMEAADSGFTVIDGVRERNLSSVVIIFTANETWFDCRRAFRHRVCWDYISKNMEGNPYEELHKSIQEAIAYFNRWGNRNDETWIDENTFNLTKRYLGQYIAVINNTVIESAQTKEELLNKIYDRKLPAFLPVIKKIESNILHGLPLKDLISAGESSVVELKSTLTINLATNKTDDTIKMQIIKTISAFLNSNGGTLLIGVNDSGNIIGLDNDYCHLPHNKDKRDAFENKLTNIIASHLGTAFASSKYLKIRFESADDKDVCIIDISKSEVPVFISPTKEYYVRTGNSSRQLNTEEFYKLILNKNIEIINNLIP